MMCMWVFFSDAFIYLFTSKTSTSSTLDKIQIEDLVIYAFDEYTSIINQGVIIIIPLLYPSSRII